MDVALSITGALAALISVSIGLLSFTADARLYRRIEKLRSVDELMTGAPSPVIHRSLRMCLADLQARELLREKLRTSRLAVAILTFATIVSSLTLTLFMVGPVLVESLEKDRPSTIFGIFVWIFSSMLTCILLTRHHVFALRRDDYMSAFFHGVAPSQDQLELSAFRVMNHPRWRRALATSLLSTVACMLCGSALGMLSFALLAPEYALLYVALSVLIGAFALGIGAFGMASAAESAHLKIWPAPARQDFVTS